MNEDFFINLVCPSKRNKYKKLIKKPTKHKTYKSMSKIKYKIKSHKNEKKILNKYSVEKFLMKK